MLKKLVQAALITIVAATLLPSCKILNSNIMLRTGSDYEYAQHPDTALMEYKIHANDQIDFSLFANDGFKLIDMQTSGNGSQNARQGQQGFSYLIEFDGKAKLPVLGRVNLAGMTIRQAENYLENEYKAYYKEPFVILKVRNKRVIVFPGEGGAANVLNLVNENTTLIEAIAMAGGIQDNGKAHKIKLIRGDLKSPEVYLIDLSTIEGVKEADLVLQANDIIYVEPRQNFTTEVLNELSPIIGLISSTFLIFTAINTLSGN